MITEDVTSRCLCLRCSVVVKSVLAFAESRSSPVLSAFSTTLLNRFQLTAECFEEEDCLSFHWLSCDSCCCCCCQDVWSRWFHVRRWWGLWSGESMCDRWSKCFSSFIYFVLGILWRLQFRAWCWLGESVLQLKVAEGGQSAESAGELSEGAGHWKWRKGRVGLQGSQTDDQNQFQTGNIEPYRIVFVWC